MRAIYEDVKYRDITFKLDSGTLFGAHRVVLDNSGVEWFEKLLSGRFGDAKQEVIEVHEVSDLSFEIILKWCYKIERDVTRLEDIEHYFHTSAMFIQPKLVETMKNPPWLSPCEWKLELAKWCCEYDDVFAQFMFDLKLDWSYCITQYGAAKINIELLRYVIFNSADYSRIVFSEITHGLISWFGATFEGISKPSIEHRDISLKLLDVWMRSQDRCHIIPVVKCSQSWLQILVKEGYLNGKDLSKVPNTESRACIMIPGEPIRLGILLDQSTRDLTAKEILGYYNSTLGVVKDFTFTHYIVPLE